MGDALAKLSEEGVSVWLDDISRERLRTGNLQQLIDTKHIVGVTSNPTIFQKALEKGDAYNEQVALLTKDIKLSGLKNSTKVQQMAENFLVQSRVDPPATGAKTATAASISDLLGGSSTNNVLALFGGSSSTSILDLFG